MGIKMTTNIKKNRKKRGHVSAGHGRIGKHRKHPGGRGNAGGQHHHRISFDKYHPGYFGKVGMRYLHKSRSKLHRNIINLEKIWPLISSLSNTHSQKDSTKAVLLDVTKQGYTKVLGKGKLPKQPLVIMTSYISKLAEKKAKLQEVRL